LIASEIFTFLSLINIGQIGIAAETFLEIVIEAPFSVWLCHTLHCCVFGKCGSYFSGIILACARILGGGSGGVSSSGVVLSSN
jgi:hypothetical protein